MQVELLTDEEKREWKDMQKCYHAIQKAREIRKSSLPKRGLNIDGTARVGASHTSIPMEMWEALQPVIEEGLYDDPRVQPDEEQEF